MCAHILWSEHLLSIDEQAVERAPERLRAVGTSLNQEIRQHLLHIVGGDELQRDVELLERTSGLGKPHTGRKWNRDETYQERMKWPRN